VLRGTGQTGRLFKPRGAGCGPSGRRPVIYIQEVGAALYARIAASQRLSRRWDAAIRAYSAVTGAWNRSEHP